jgi:hypothetical protein
LSIAFSSVERATGLIERGQRDVEIGMDRRDEPADVRQDVDPAAQTEVRTEVFAGFVFVNLDPDARPMAEWYPEAERELRAFVPHLERLNPALWIEIPEARNWKVAVENYSECYHCQLNHAGEYSSWFLFPDLLVSGLPRQRAQHLHWRPAAVDRVAVWRGWYTEGGLESDVITKLAQQDRWTTVDEDIRLVESVQRGLGSRGYRPGPLITDPRCGVSSEHSVKALHDWIRTALGVLQTSNAASTGTLPPRQRGQEHPLSGHDGEVWSLAYSPDGKHLVTGSHDKTIRIWDLTQPLNASPTKDIADMICQEVWRNMTLGEWHKFVGVEIPYERTCPNLPIHPSLFETAEKLAKGGDVAGAAALLEPARQLDPDLDLDPEVEAERLAGSGTSS